MRFCLRHILTHPVIFFPHADAEVVLRNGYCQLYNTEGKLVTTYSVNDAKFVRFVGDDQLAIHRRNGRVEIHDFTGRLVRVSA